MTLPPPWTLRPRVFWGAQEVAIDAFHHTVYAVATGIAYGLLSSNGPTSLNGAAALVGDG